MSYSMSSPYAGSWYNSTPSYGQTPVAYYPPATPSLPSTPYPVNIPTPQLKPVDVPIPNPVVQIKPISIDTYVPHGVPLNYYYPPVNYSYPPAPVPPPVVSYPPPAPPPVVSYPPPPPVSYPPPPPPPAVGQNQHGALFGDPHVLDPDSGLKGTNTREDFDFNGKGLFSVLKDSNVALNANLVAGPNSTTVTKEAGLTLGSDKIGINVAGQQLDATLNGAKVNGQATFNGNKVTDTGSDIKVDTGSDFEYNFLFQPETFGGMSYINTHVYSKDQGVGNGQLPTGILGSIWGDGKVSKAPSGSNSSFAVSGLF